MLTELSPRALLSSVAIGVAVCLSACSGSDGPTALTQVPLSPWDGGADAGCSVGHSGTTIQCGIAYRVTGDPYACPGFADGGLGEIPTCESICESRICALSGLSDGTSAVVCTTVCPAIGSH